MCDSVCFFQSSFCFGSELIEDIVVLESIGREGEKKRWRETI